MTEDDVNRPTTDNGPTHEEPFALAGNEIRTKIIHTFGEAYIQEGPSHALSFSELRSRTDTDIDPAQLNYHLQKLVGHFVAKTDGGYVLHPKGKQVYLALQAGTFEQRERQVSVKAQFDCYYCQAPVRATLSGARAKVACPECEYTYLDTYTISPLGAYEDEMAAFEQFSKYTHHKLLGYARGICQTCGNAMESQLVSSKAISDLGVGPPNERPEVYVRLSCDNCGTCFNLFVGIVLLVDLEFITFCYNHGVDILSTPYWELEFAVTDKPVTVHSTDPWEVALRVTLGDDTFELVVDSELNVVERNHLEPIFDKGTSLVRAIKNDVGRMGSREDTDDVGRPTNTDCLEQLRSHRWPDEVTCPHCDSTDTIRKGTTSKDSQRYYCHTCDTIFNDLTETIFAEHRLTLSEMFYIIQKRDERTAAQLARQLDRSHQSVLNFLREVEEIRSETPASACSPPSRRVIRRDRQGERG